MEIRWRNLFAFALAVFALVVAVKGRHEIGAFLATLGALGPGHTPDEQTVGLVAFGLLAVTILALALILKSNPRRR